LEALEKEHRAFEATLEKLALANSFLQERQRWPRLLGELQRYIQPGMWITQLGVLPSTETTEKIAPGGRPAPLATPVVEIGGMFETKSKEADARAVESFREALDQGGILKKVVLIERETPREMDGRTEQVALTFRLQGEWPLESTTPPAGETKPATAP